MLVTFRSSTAGELIMFAPPARVVLGLLGKECTARGVITEAEVPTAIAKLECAVVDWKKSPPEAAPDVAEANDPGRPVVGSLQRAVPFLDFLRRTRQGDAGFILWQAASDFGTAQE